MGKCACPKCKVVFDSDLEYRMHWSHNHFGVALAPLVQLVSPGDKVAAVEIVEKVEKVEEVEVLVDEAPYSLAASREGLGELSPVLKDAEGNVIDGFHRLGENANWHSITVPSIDTPVKLELARLAVNFNRRKVSSEELAQRITFLIKNGLKPEDIAKQTGISRSTIYKYTPQEHKDPSKVESGSKRANLNESRQEAKSLAPPAEFYKRKESVSTSSTALTSSTSCTESIPDLEPEVIPEGCPICPCCGTSMNLSEFEEVKQTVAKKFGKQVQTLLFTHQK